jgi:hypothetical protein
MNSNLYNTEQGNVVIPKEIKDLLRNSFAQVRGANENTEGFNRNQELQKQEITETLFVQHYKLLERMMT